LNAFFHLPVSCKFALWFLWAFMPGSLPRYYFIYVVLFLWAEHTAESRCRIRQHTLVEINLLLLHNTTVCIMLKLWLWVWIIINWWKWIILYRCKIRLLNANVETTEFYQHIDSLSCNSDEVLADVAFTGHVWRAPQGRPMDVFFWSSTFCGCCASHSAIFQNPQSHSTTRTSRPIHLLCPRCSIQIVAHATPKRDCNFQPLVAACILHYFFSLKVQLHFRFAACSAVNSDQPSSLKTGWTA
jgi:hypothetical protein